MKKNKKLMAYLLATGIMLSGCSIEAKTSSETTIPTTSITEVTKEPTIEPTIEETIAPPENDILCATTEVNLRTAPTTSSYIVGSLKLNDKVECLANYNGWTLVNFDGQIAFASSDYLESTTEKTPQEYKYEIKNDIVLTTTELNFREKPSAESERILTFPENTELQVLAETDNNWLLVKSNNIIGYVHKDYTYSLLERLNEVYPYLEISDLSTQKVVYATTNLNIRQGNSTDDEVIDQLEFLESVRVLAEYDDWYLIMTNNYDFGFVNKNYTDELNEEYVIVDLDSQTLYLYNGNDQYIKTPITSGKDSTPSDKGLFKIYYKSTNTPLIGDDYNVTVDYWMNYNNGEGLHDASWRSSFGNDSYHYAGSHGCINIPPHLADDVYNYTQVGTKVLVHK